MREFEVFKNFILDPIFCLLYFPIWWYSRGLTKFVAFLKRAVEEIACPFVLKILVQNLVKPMYGDYSREGRVISFFMRIIHLSWRIFKIAFVFFIAAIAFIFYLLVLPLIFYKIICILGNTCHYFLWYPII